MPAAVNATGIPISVVVLEAFQVGEGGNKRRGLKIYREQAVIGRIGIPGVMDPGGDRVMLPGGQVGSLVKGINDGVVGIDGRDRFRHGGPIDSVSDRDIARRQGTVISHLYANRLGIG